MIRSSKGSAFLPFSVMKTRSRSILSIVPSIATRFLRGGLFFAGALGELISKSYQRKTHHRRAEGWAGPPAQNTIRRAAPSHPPAQYSNVFYREDMCAGREGLVRKRPSPTGDVPTKTYKGRD